MLHNLPKYTNTIKKGDIYANQWIYRKKDAWAKVTGDAKYKADIAVEVELDLTEYT